MTLMASCSTNYEDKIVYNDIQQPFQQDFKKDTVVFDKLPAEFAKHILNLSDPSNGNRRQGRLHLPDQQPDQREEIGSGRFARHHQLECENRLQRHPRDVYPGG